MREINRKAFVLNGETLTVETPGGGIRIQVDSASIATVELIPYDGAKALPKAPVILDGSSLAPEWLGMWSEDRQPFNLYHLLRRLED